MSVTAIDVVTAGGELIHADETENAELLWAARGAGPGFFGVVTRFHLRVYPLRRVTMGSRYYFPASCAAEVFRFLHDIGRETPLELAVLVQRNALTDYEPAVILGAVAYTDTEAEARAQLALLETCPVRSEALGSDLYQPTTHGADELDESTAVPNEARRWIADNISTNAGFDEIWPGVESIIADMPAAPTYLMAFNWDGLPSAPQRPDMAFSLEGELCYSLYTAWDDAAADVSHRDWTTESMRVLEPHAWGTMLSDENLLNRPSRFMAGENMERLDALRAEWDPEGRFVSWLGRPE